jgi:ubiquinone biosynthesis monooxygenase Coq7
MDHRSNSIFDRLIGEIDKALKVLTVPARAARVSPAEAPETELQQPGRQRSGNLMRVNHAGEVAAQGLYQGQALTARDRGVRAAMQQAAAEETDHLAWCAGRLAELGKKPSVLNPLWYGGSFAMGALAGAWSDRVSLGFVAETERQVEAHLHGHLNRLDPADLRSREILEQMSRDEAHHGAKATDLGAQELPILVKWAMRATAKVMTKTSYWV